MDSTTKSELEALVLKAAERNDSQAAIILYTVLGAEASGNLSVLTKMCLDYANSELERMAEGRVQA